MPRPKIDVTITERGVRGEVIAVRAKTMYHEEDIRVGSVWRSRDSRDNGREVQVTHLYNEHAQVQNTKTGRRTTVRLARFLGEARTGYRKVRA